MLRDLVEVSSAVEAMRGERTKLAAAGSVTWLIRRHIDQNQLSIIGDAANHRASVLSDIDSRKVDQLKAHFMRMNSQI